MATFLNLRQHVAVRFITDGGMTFPIRTYKKVKIFLSRTLHFFRIRSRRRKASIVEELLRTDDWITSKADCAASKLSDAQQTEGCESEHTHIHSGELWCKGETSKTNEEVGTMKCTNAIVVTGLLRPLSYGHNANW
ncbi:hypothetical protein CBL_10358 [Carabus blaptoides fortunei]